MTLLLSVSGYAINQPVSLQRISNTTMIMYDIGAEQGSQYISKRDFVAVYSQHTVLDTHRMLDDFYMCYVSTEFPEAPSEGEHVR